ncbi:hypothetical protein C1X65_16670 [Pseudomonas sp. FW305-70]|nr:hypothetical protein C1X65_16670 [Pseudomonas sp. FW305-70]
MPAKNDDAVWQIHRVVPFAGKPRSYGSEVGCRALVHFDDEPIPLQPRSWAALRQRTRCVVGGFFSDLS